MNSKTLLATVLFAGLSCVLFGADIKDALREAGALAGKRDHQAAIRFLADAASKADVSFGQRKEAAYQVARYIHSADKSAYPALREALEALLKIDGLTDKDKKFLLDSIYGTYFRAGDYQNAVKSSLRILELKDLPDPMRADVLDSVARLYIHHFRDLDKGRGYFHSCLDLRRKEADAIADPLEKARRLTRIGEIYRLQTLEPEQAKQAFRDAVALYTGELPKLEGTPKAKAYVALVELYDRLKMKEEAAKCRDQAVTEYGRILDQASRLAPAEWVKAVSPRDAMDALRQTPEGARKALELAEKMFSMRQEKVIRDQLDGVLNMATWIAGWGPDASLRSRYSHFVEYQVQLAKSPSRRHYYQLQLGEAYFRRDLELEKARKVFAEVASSPEASAKDRETAGLWCEMLSDTGQ